MKLISLKCANCGADLQVDSSRENCFCSYCGHKLLIDDESVKIKGGFNFGYEQEIGRHQAFQDIKANNNIKAKIEELKEEKATLQKEFKENESLYNISYGYVKKITMNKIAIVVISIIVGLAFFATIFTNPEFNYLGDAKLLTALFCSALVPGITFLIYSDNNTKAIGYKKRMDKKQLEIDEINEKIKRLEDIIF